MNWEKGELVRVRVQLKHRGATEVAGQVRAVDRDEVIVATMAGLRTVRPPDLAPW